MTTTTATPMPIRCACGNIATVSFGYRAPACEWCADHEACKAPTGVQVRAAWLTGEPVAECGCGWRCHYWECACELAHNCAGGDA